MDFAKYQGIGNDFVLVADLDDSIRLSPDLVRRLCDRRFGIGADGVIRIVRAADGADFAMDYVNSDGSVSEMCGNGIRCLAVYVRAEGFTDKSDLEIETLAGRKTVTINGDDTVRVDIGAPIFEPARIPVSWDGSDALHAKFEVGDEVVEAACLSLGNPHGVVFVEDPGAAPVTTLGPRLETHAAFPNRANIEFVTTDARNHITTRVWERGSGETLACGTGACAAMVAARLLSGAETSCTVSLPGGDLVVEWDGDVEQGRSVYMTGPAVEVFRGEIELTES